MKRKGGGGGKKWYQSIDFALANCGYLILHRFKEPWLFKQKKLS